jgi:hypothetical protein
MQNNHTREAFNILVFEFNRSWNQCDIILMDEVIDRYIKIRNIVDPEL